MSTTQLAKNLVQKRPSEEGGKHAGRGFAYQANWILCKLLDLFEQEDDFAVLIEWHDDMAFMDSPTAPTALEFYQVKSTKGRGPWNPAKILALKNGRSILGKLCRHLKTFPDGVTKLTLVCNVGFDLKMADGEGTDSLHDVQFKDAHEDMIQTLTSRLSKELGKDYVEGCLNIAVFQRSTLSLEKMERDAKGHLVDFLEHHYAGQTFHVPALYKTLKAEIDTRAIRDAKLRDLTSLLESKGITKSGLGRNLQSALIGEQAKDKVERACSQLQDEGWNHEQQQRLRSYVREYELNCLSLRDEQFVKLRQTVAEAHRRLAEEEHETADLKDKLVKICELTRTTTPNGAREFDDSLINIVVIVEHEYEYEQD